MSARTREDERSSLVPQGPHEQTEDDWSETEDAPPLGWEDEPEHRADAHDRHAGSTASDEAHEEEQYEERDEERYEDSAQQQEAHDRERHADPYGEHLERLAATLRSLRPETDTAAPKLPPAPQIRPAARSAHSADAPEREVYIDGTRLPRFLHASYVAPPPGREGGIGFLGAMIAVGIACTVAAPLAYYVAFGNPFTSAPPAIRVKSDLQYAVASTSTSLPRPEPESPPLVSVVAPNVPVAQAPPQPAPQQRTALWPAEPQAQPPVSLQGPRAVPLTHVMRWPDSAQDSGAAQPQVPSVAPAPEPPRANASTPSAPTSALALAPASETIPERPARQRPPARSAEEIELLLKQGQDFVAAGDLATARIVLRRAAEAGVAAAALALGQTYDRKVLAKMGARGVVPDGDEARRWYETAQRLGSSEAAQRLERLARDE
jgi:hypothetical protein